MMNDQKSKVRPMVYAAGSKSGPNRPHKPKVTVRFQGPIQRGIPEIRVRRLPELFIYHIPCTICYILYYTILYYTILYYTILYYTILYYTILYSTLLYSTILYSTILYYTILYYTILYHTTLYSTLLYSTLLYSTLLYSTLLYSTLLYSTLLYSTLLYSTLLYSIHHLRILMFTWSFWALVSCPGLVERPIGPRPALVQFGPGPEAFLSGSKIWGFL